MTKIIPIEERIGKNMIVKFPIDDEGAIVFKWMTEDAANYYTCIHLDREAVSNLIDCMQKKGLI